MRYELKSIGIWAFIKIAFFLNLIVGFVFGLFYAMFMIVFLAMAASMPFMNLQGVDPEALNPGIIFVTMPLMFSFIGAVFVTMFELIVLVLYNLFSRFLGGLELNLDPVSTSTALSQPAIPSVKYSPPVDQVLPAAPTISSVLPVKQPPPPPSLSSSGVSSPSEASVTEAIPAASEHPVEQQQIPVVQPKSKSDLPDFSNTQPIAPVSQDEATDMPRRTDDSSDKNIPPQP